MPDPDGPSWPETPGDTTDWEMVFEDPETGFIPLIAQAHSPEALKQGALVVIRKLFNRKGDQSNIEKLAAVLDKIVAGDAAAADLDAMRAGVTDLLRRIKEERQREAAAYQAHRKAGKVGKNGERRVAGETEKDGEKSPAKDVKESRDKSPAGEAEETEEEKDERPAGEAEEKEEDGDESPTEKTEEDAKEGDAEEAEKAVEENLAAAKRRRAQLKPAHEEPPAKSYTALIVAAVLTALVAALVIVPFLPDSAEKEARKEAAVQWVDHYVGTHLRIKSAKLVSVKMSEDSLIELDIIIAGAPDVETIKAMSLMDRVAILELICPPPDSGVVDITDQGWQLWVMVRSQDEKLTGGTCRY